MTDPLAPLVWQATAFAPSPSRVDLLRLKPPWPTREVRVRVHRNQPFEFVAGVLAPFLAGADLRPTFEIGDYDDALAGAGTAATPPDAELVWLDWARYLASGSPAAAAGWLAGRIAAIRARSVAPVLVASSARSEPAHVELNELLATAFRGMAGVHLVDQAGVARDLGDEYWDARSEGFAGTSMGDRAAIETARRLGLSWLPAVLVPRLKVLAVDLDNTLYDGVLAEDGFRGVCLSPARAALQRRVVELADRGLMLAVVSRNEPRDVTRLFEARPDFPLRLDRISATAIGWTSRAEGLAHVAATLRVGPESVLLVDDNPGELASVGAALPEVRLLHAADAGQAGIGLRWYPGLPVFESTREDALRAADLASVDARERLRDQASDPAAYLRSLGARLIVNPSPAIHRSRIHELSSRTNQFNTGLLRLSEPDVELRLHDPESIVVTVALADRLSDSGIVGLVVGRRTTEGPAIEEVAISCRALGRGLEDAIVLEALAAAAGRRPASVQFRLVEGPRNEPARDWLARLAGGPVAEPSVRVPWARVVSLRQAYDGLVEVVREE